jgi:hypothetical protein
VIKSTDTIVPKGTMNVVDGAPPPSPECFDPFGDNFTKEDHSGVFFSWHVGREVGSLVYSRAKRWFTRVFACQKVFYSLCGPFFVAGVFRVVVARKDANHN